MEGDQLIAEAVILGHARQGRGGIVVVKGAQAQMLAGVVRAHHQLHGEAGDDMVCAAGKGQGLVIARHGGQQVDLAGRQLLPGLPPVHAGDIDEIPAAEP